jgi:hypothetical protein
LGYFLFILYLVVCCWSFTIVKFVQRAKIPYPLLWLVFIGKVSVGVVHGWLTRHNIEVDNWGYHRDALKEYHSFFGHPWQYFTNIFSSGSRNSYGNYLAIEHSFWNDIKTNLTVKLLSVLHFFSGGNYYVNVILYNFLVMLGLVVLYKLLVHFYPAHRLQMFLLSFCLPSVFMFGSVIHKEGWVLMAISVILYFLLVRIKGFWQYGILALLLLFILLLRNYVLLMLLPACIAFWCCKKISWKPAYIFLLVYLLLLVLAILMPHIKQELSLPAMLAQKQLAFNNLERANSYLANTPLQPTWQSLYANFPEALQHGFLRPFITDYRMSPYLLFFFAEMLLYGMLVLWGIGAVANKRWQPFALAMLFFAGSVLLITGYTVTVLWAIVRYRSIYFPFLLAPFMAYLPIEKLAFVKKIKLLRQLNAGK